MEMENYTNCFYVFFNLKAASFPESRMLARFFEMKEQIFFEMQLIACKPLQQNVVYDLRITG